VKGAVILVVEDDPHVRAALVDVLRFAEFEPVEAVDPVDALEQLASGLEPRVILLDYMMPRGGGTAFRKGQLADPRWAEIPVLMMTADRRITSEAAPDPGVAYLPKPVDMNRLIAAVEARLREGSPPGAG
jgi:CheY-like chemotaxis protein